MSLVPYLAKVAVYWREEESDQADAELRVLVYTEEEGEKPLDNSLETREGFLPVVVSPELVVREKGEVEVRVRGNLVNVATAPPRLVFKPFRENRCTLPVKRVQGNIPAAGTLEIVTDHSTLWSSSILVPMGKKAS